MASVSKAILPGYDRLLSPADKSELYDFILREGLVSIEPALPTVPLIHAGSFGRPLPRRPRAVLIDVYGTLLASGLGEVGASEEVLPPHSTVFSGRSAFPPDFGAHLQALIAKDHAKARAGGRPWPEIDAISIFMKALGLEAQAAARACVAWECIANPCSAMPGASDFLAECRQSGLSLGIVSNAQFYTPLFIKAAFGIEAEGLGLEPGLSFWSYQTGRAKPDRFMYDMAAEALAARGIAAYDAVYVGNDALNDCASAGEVGFMTVLFAGDARSFRPREFSPQVAKYPPSTIVSGWSMLATILASSRA